MNRLVRMLKNKWFIIGVSVLIIYTLSGFFLVPYLVRHYVPRIVHEKIDKKAGIGEVRFNPYIFTFEANEFSIVEPDDRLIVGFKRFFVDFELKSFFKRAWTFRQIALEKPRVNAEIAPDCTLNLAQLAPPTETPSDKEAKEIRHDKQEPPARFIIEDILIDRGRIDLVDKRQSVPAEVSLTPMNLHIQNLTTLREGEGQKTITATTGDGETFRWTGNFKLNPVAMKGSVAIENLQIATIWKFFRDAVNLDTPGGEMTVMADYDIDLGDTRDQVTLDHLDVTLTGMVLKLAGAEAPFLELPDTRISDAQLDFLNQRVDVGKIAVADGLARLEADESGVFNLERIIKTADAACPAVEPPSESESTLAEPWKINLNAFEMDGFAFDYRDMSRISGLKAGIGDIEVDLKLESRAGGPQTELTAGNIRVGLSGVSAGPADRPEPAVRIDKLTLEDGAYDLSENRFTAGKISINGGGIDFLRQADGTSNLALMAEPPKRETVVEKPEQAPDEGSAFSFLINTIDLSGLGAAFSDFSVKPDRPILNLEDITLVLNHIDGKSPMTFDAGLKVSQGGQIKAAGTVNPSANSVQSDIQVTDLKLTPFQPYIDTAVSLTLQSGAVSTHGILQYGIDKAKSQTVFEGGFEVDKLRLVEPGSAGTFLGWENLQTESLKLQLQPNRLEIGTINLAQLAGKFVIYEDRTLNVVKVIKNGPGVGPRSPAPTKAGDKAADLFPVVVRKINLSDGGMEFADLSLRPQFGTKIHELKGTIVGVSTAAGARAQVRLDGRVDNYGTAKVEGELNTFDPKAFMNMGLVFRNMEIINLTPYSGRFAGRKIDSGKLSVDLKYLIENSRLTGDNQIVVERIKLGEKVESPDAVNLPLDIAVALMEDSKGVIDIGLPVKGNLDAPEFSFGGLIWKALTNLLTKVATSPFRALGALIPGGGDETLNTVIFEAGSSDVPPPEKEKLDKLVEALKKRPKLKLTISGRYNPETDMAVLLSRSMRRALALRQGQKLEPGQDPGPVDWSHPETGKLLAEMFVERFGADALKDVKEELKAAEEKKKKEPGAAPKAENKDSGRLAKILFSRLADSEPIGEKELVMLAEERARAIVGELGGPDGLPEERLEIKPPASARKKDQPSALLNLEPIR